MKIISRAEAGRWGNKIPHERPIILDRGIADVIAFPIDMMANTRRALYKHYRLEGMSGVSAAIKAGYSPSTARCGKLHKAVGLDLAKTLERRGLSNQVIADTIIDGLSAKKENGVKDYYAAHKYLETALKVRGDIRSDGLQTMVDKMQVNVFLPSSEVNPAQSQAKLT